MKQKPLESVLVIVLGLILLFYFRRWNGWLLAALLTGSVAVLSPKAAHLIHRAWMGLSLLLGEVSGKLLLTVTYILILIPLSFLARRFGKSGLRRKPGGNTYFTDRGHRYESEDFIHPW